MLDKLLQVVFPRQRLYVTPNHVDNVVRWHRNLLLTLEEFSGEVSGPNEMMLVAEAGRYEGHGYFVVEVPR